LLVTFLIGENKYFDLVFAKKNGSCQFQN